MKLCKILSRRSISVILGFSLISACGSDEDSTTAASTDNFTLNGAGSGVTALASTPAAASLSIYQFAVSENEDCSDASVVIDNGDSPADFNMLESPEIGTGVIADGTYPCVVLVMTPELSVTPATTEGACTAGESFSQNVCAGGSDQGSTINLDGELVDCSDSTDKAYLYLSTGSSLTNAAQDSDNCRGENADERTCSSWEPPTADNPYLGIPLGNALEVSGTQVGVFTLGDLSVGDEGGEGDNARCGMGRPTFTFVSE